MGRKALGEGMNKTVQEGEKRVTRHHQWFRNILWKKTRIGVGILSAGLGGGVWV